MLGEFTTPTPSYTGTTDGNLDAAAEANTYDVAHLREVTVQLIQVTDAGTVTLKVEGTIDGVSFSELASKAETDFAVGDGASIKVAVGLETWSKIRVRASALAAGGVYSSRVAGHR